MTGNTSFDPSRFYNYKVSFITTTVEYCDDVCFNWQQSQAYTMRGLWSDSFIQWAEEQDEEASSYCEGHEHVISEHDGDLQSFDERTHSSDPIALTIGTGGWRSGTHEFFRYVRYSVNSSDSITAWDEKGDRTYILFHGSMFFGTLSTR